MYCQRCGALVQDGSKFCNNCGAEVNAQQAQNTVEYIYSLPPENSPVSPWRLLGLKILFAIPIVGFICLIAYSFNDNVNIKNFARLYWCELLVGIIILIFLIASGVSEDVIESIMELFNDVISY